MYYIWSFVISIIISYFIQYNEYEKNPNEYKLFTLINITTFFVLYLIITIIFYFIFEIDYKCVNKIKKRGGNSDTSIIDIDVVKQLKNIKEETLYGFEPKYE